MYEHTEETPENALSNIGFKHNGFMYQHSNVHVSPDYVYLKVAIDKKIQVGNDQEMIQSERNSHSTNRGVGKK